MGLVLDSSVLIAGERRSESVRSILEAVQGLHGHEPIGISSVTVAELTHGLFRARSERQREARRIFIDDVCEALNVYPLTTQVAKIAGRLSGEHAAAGVSIGFPDLAIAATALSLVFPLVTHNGKHFTGIPSLTVLLV